MAKILGWSEQPLIFLLRPFVKPVWWVIDNVIPDWVIGFVSDTFFWRLLVLALVVERWVI
jgi:hypothetical protein